jgi:hypothetical protein
MQKKNMERLTYTVKSKKEALGLFSLLKYSEVSAKKRMVSTGKKEN